MPKSQTFDAQTRCANVSCMSPVVLRAQPGDEFVRGNEPPLHDVGLILQDLPLGHRGVVLVAQQVQLCLHLGDFLVQLVQHSLGLGGASRKHSGHS